MFGNIGQLMNLMKNMGQLKQTMQEVGERLQAARFTGEAGGGQAQATVNGRGEIVSLKLDPELVKGGDVEMIEELVCGAVRDAVTHSRTAAQKEMAEFTGGLNVPGLDNLFGGTP
jgi:nucleoid-associated protein EbfC